MANYYYDERGIKRGPVDRQQIRELAESGIIKPDTLIEAASGIRVIANNVSGLNFAPPSLNFSQRTAAYSETLCNTLNTYFMVMCITLIMVMCITLSILIFISSILVLPLPLLDPTTLNDMSKEEVEKAFAAAMLPFLLLGGIGFIVSIVSMVFWGMLHYQLWKLIPNDIARTTPGKAVGFLFIPVFNCYWCFVSYLGLSQNMNEAFRRRKIQYWVSEGLALTLCILVVIGCFAGLFPVALFPAIIGYVFALLYSIVFILYYKSVKDGAIVLLKQGQ